MMGSKPGLTSPVLTKTIHRILVRTDEDGRQRTVDIVVQPKNNEIRGS
jgi:hypothetical protein